MPDPANDGSKTYTIHSTGLVHGPGMLGWLKNVHATDPAEAYKLLATSLPGIPLGLAALYFEGLAEVDEDPEAGTVALTYPGDDAAGKLLAEAVTSQAATNGTDFTTEEV